MTLDEAIKHCLEVADKNEISAITFKNCKEIKTNMYEKLTAEKAENDCRECATDHKQLAEWLTELKEAKRLLKAAVEDLSCGGENNKCTKSCNTCTHSSIKGYGCRYFGEYHWRYADEALALIGKDTNVPASAGGTNVGRKSGGWISCEERLPEPGTMVIVASYGSDIVIPEDGETVEECCERLKQECVRVTLGFIGSDGWYGSDYFPLIVTPSFWQPLPEPPKDGSGGRGDDDEDET